MQEIFTDYPLCAKSGSRHQYTMMGFPGGLAVNNPPAMQEMQGQSPGWDDPLEKEVATHSGVLAWEIPWTEEPGGLQSVGSQELDTT